MKKLFILAAILALTSCRLKDNTKPTAVMPEGVPFRNIIEFKYKKHEYIKFSDGNQCGVVHSPECKECWAIFD